MRDAGGGLASWVQNRPSRIRSRALESLAPLRRTFIPPLTLTALHLDVVNRQGAQPSVPLRCKKARVLPRGEHRCDALPQLPECLQPLLLAPFPHHGQLNVPKLQHLAGAAPDHRKVIQVRLTRRHMEANVAEYVLRLIVHAEAVQFRNDLVPEGFVP